jgi:hypothetical protein
MSPAVQHWPEEAFGFKREDCGQTVVRHCAKTPLHWSARWGSRPQLRERREKFAMACTAHLCWIDKELESLRVKQGKEKGV